MLSVKDPLSLALPIEIGIIILIKPLFLLQLLQTTEHVFAFGTIPFSDPLPQLLEELSFSLTEFQADICLIQKRLFLEFLAFLS